MLRPAPQPISEICLSIDTGSINAAVCLFDGSPSAQQILWLDKRQLLDQHASVVHDYEAIQRHLDLIKYQVETLLQGRPYWVLVEQQFLDRDSKERGLVFNLQLESAVAMYFKTHNIDVRLIQATKRFPFLGVDGWAKDTRYERKQNVVARVKDLLDPKKLPGNRFSRRQHNLEVWDKLTDVQRHDIADAIAQCLHYYYRNIHAVLECTVAPPVTAGNQSLSAAAAAAQAGPSSRQDRPKPRKNAVKGKLEQTLGRLHIKYRDLLEGESIATKKLFKVWEREPNNPHLVGFLETLNDYNSRGNQITSEAELEQRLTPYSPSAAAMETSLRLSYNAR